MANLTSSRQQKERRSLTIQSPDHCQLMAHGAPFLTTLRLQNWEIMVGLQNPSDVKVSAPAMNVAQSLKFYKALGWKVNWRADNDNSAELELTGN